MIAHMSGWMWWGMGVMVVFSVAAIAFGVWAVRRFTERPRSSPLHILEERFARGEIDPEEFERQRALLGPDA
jgi:putative membrane protein